MQTKTKHVAPYYYCLLVALILFIPSFSFSAQSPSKSTSTIKSKAGANKAVDIGKILKRAAEDAASIKNDGLRPFVLGQIVEKQAQTGDFTAAYATVKRIDNEFSASDALKYIAVKQAEAGNFKSALETVERINEKSTLHAKAKVLALCQIAEIESKAGARDAAKRIFEKAIEAANSETRNLSKAQDLLDIAAAQIRVNDRRAAGQLLGQAFSLIVKIDPGSLKGFRDPVSQVIEPELLKLAAAYAKAADVGDALKAVDAIKNQSTKQDALRAIVRAQVENRDVEGATRLATLVGNNPNLQRVLRMDIMIEQARLGEVKGAVKTLDTFYDEYWDRFVFHIVMAQLRANDLDGAFRTATRIKDNVGELSQIAIGYADRGNEKRAKEVLKMALDKAGSATAEASLRVPSHALASLTLAQAKAGDFQGAIRTVEQIPDPYERVVKLRNIAELQHQNRDGKNIEMTLRRAIAIAGTLPKNNWKRADALTAIGLVQAKAGYQAAASQTLSEAVESGAAVRDMISRPGVLSRTAKAQAEIGDAEGALETVMRYLTMERDKAKAFQEIAAVQARRGETQAALAWANAQPPPLRANALLGIAAGVLGDKK